MAEEPSFLEVDIPRLLFGLGAPNVIISVSRPVERNCGKAHSPQRLKVFRNGLYQGYKSLFVLLTFHMSCLHSESQKSNSQTTPIHQSEKMSHTSNSWRVGFGNSTPQNRIKSGWIQVLPATLGLCWTSAQYSRCSSLRPGRIVGKRVALVKARTSSPLPHVYFNRESPWPKVARKKGRQVDFPSSRASNCGRSLYLNDTHPHVFPQQGPKNSDTK